MRSVAKDRADAIYGDVSGLCSRADVLDPMVYGDGIPAELKTANPSFWSDMELLWKTAIEDDNHYIWRSALVIAAFYVDERMRDEFVVRMLGSNVS